MAIRVEIQNDDNLSKIPKESEFLSWVEAALVQSYDDLEQTIRVVNEAESRDLNLQFRGKDKPTNVLSFPSQSPLLDYDCLGDLVICAPLVSEEAEQQNKSRVAHWAHLVVHGMLHLQGYDHEKSVDAVKMEALEVEILSTLGYSNPYNV
ncbi:MAG: rRNA maturation RNase YbeY [Gammaproteobacteria bacterium]|nr:rRNA maturation RNase YbeY [Gammaproteobacteria bacterium]